MDFEFWKDQRVLVTGGHGFLGKHVVRALPRCQELWALRHEGCDLTSQFACNSTFRTRGPTLVIHLAAKCGGIGANQSSPFDFLRDNLLMNTNVVDSCIKYGVKKLVCLGSVCFTEDAFVKSKNSYLPINQIINGSSIVSEFNKQATVNHTMKRLYSGQIIKIKPRGSEELRVTPEHPFKVADANGMFSWKAVKNITKNDLLVINKPVFRKSNNSIFIDFEAIQQVYPAKNLKNRDNSLPKHVELDEELAWLLGIYVAEGSTSKTKVQVYFSFGDEIPFIKRTADIIERRFGLPTTLRKMPNQEGYQLSCYSKQLGEWFANNFYNSTKTTAHTKIVPDLIYSCSPKIILAFLRGYFDGDGCLHFQNFAHGRNIDVAAYTTVSRSLAYQVRDLFLSFDCFGSIHKRKPSFSSIKGRIIDGCQSYAGRFNGNFANKVVELLYPDEFGALPKTIRAQHSVTEWHDDFVLVDIVSISTDTVVDTPVFNMETSDEVYTANSVVVHNCAYPSETSVPFKEESLWMGRAEKTNEPYGIAKRVLLMQLQTARQQHGLNGVYLLPANMYGPGDHDDLNMSHVIPAMFRKFQKAVETGEPVTLWGDGSPTRDFLYVEDAVDAIIAACERYDGAEPVNIGTGEETSINSLAVQIAELVGFNRRVIWDTTKPNGQMRRVLDTSRVEKSLGWKAQVPLYEGLKRTWESMK